MEMKKRLTIEMPEELFKILKKVAVDNNCTMTKLVLRTLVDKLKRDGEMAYENK